MSSVDTVRWAVTAVFALCAGLYLAQARAASDWSARTAWSLHVVMSVAMIAMAWPWGMRVPLICLVLVFTAAALYFAYLGLFSCAVRHAAYHGAMMASMVVMAVAMSATPPARIQRDLTPTMPGMDMTGPVVSGSPALWVVLVCAAMAVAFLGASATSFYALIRGPGRPWANLLMTSGMGVAFAAIAIAV